MTKRSSPRPQRATEATSEKTRVTLDLSPGGYARLQRLAKAAGAPAATVLRNSLQLYEFFIEKTNQGVTFKSVDATGKETEISFIGYGD